MHQTRARGASIPDGKAARCTVLPPRGRLEAFWGFRVGHGGGWRWGQQLYMARCTGPAPQSYPECPALSQTAQVQIPVWPLTSRMTLGKLCHRSVPRFPLL